MPILEAEQKTAARKKGRKGMKKRKSRDESESSSSSELDDGSVIERRELHDEIRVEMS